MMLTDDLKTLEKEDKLLYIYTPDEVRARFRETIQKYRELINKCMVEGKE
jgi:hypothetical protein